MLKLTISQFNTDYIEFKCPECGRNDLLMNNFVCNNCNTILPNIEKIPIDIEERIEVYKDNITTGIWG